MKQTNRSFLRMGGLVLVILVALIAVVAIAGASINAAPAQAPLNAPPVAPLPAETCDLVGNIRTCELWASTGSLELPGEAIPVPIWGYTNSNQVALSLPGPTLIVNEGETVEVILHNDLGEVTALLFPGQAMIPDLTSVPVGGSKVYSFTASDPGTYLYEAGLLPNAARQVAMGMFGALIVRPANISISGTSSEDDPSYESVVLADNPTHYYRLGEASGPVADNIGSEPGDGSYGSAVTLGVPGLLTNSSNTAAGFDGTSAASFVDTGVTSLSTSAFSVEAWVHANSIGVDGHRIVAKDEIGATGAWILWINQGALRFQVRNNTDNAWVIAQAPTTPLAGSTFHVVGVFDGADAILYLDGFEVARTALGTSTTNSNGLPITIGADSDPITPRGHLFDGTIDEVALFEVALPVTQILEHFNAVNAVRGKTLTDLTANFNGLDLLGGTLSNITDGSSCTIASLTITTLTCEAQLSGGTTNAWKAGDEYMAAGSSFAYNDLAAAFDSEAVLVLSEIDTNLNADPAGFDMRDFSPQYRLINGKAFSQTAEISAGAGDRVLLRYVNGGIQQHTMGVLGMEQHLIARDGSLRPYPQWEIAESIGPGRTADTIVTMPAGADPGTKYALYDSSLLLHNNGAGFGGMLTFLTVADGTIPPPPSSGPTTGPVTLAPNPANGSQDVILSATISGDMNISAAEYFTDTGGSGIAMVASDGAFDSPTEAVKATISIADLALLSSGDHTFYVRGSDGTWGSFNFAVLHLDKLGPATHSISLAPNPSDGSQAIAVSATGNDSATGNSNITAAEYFTDTVGADGTGIALAVNPIAPIASLDGIIDSAGMAEGAYTVYVHSRDSFGQWGDYATATLIVDQTGPVTSNVVADPNPNNGSTPYNPTVFAIRVDATISDNSSTIQWAEGFITTFTGDGEGFPLSPADGLFDESVEDAYVYIPLSTISTLGVGYHDILVHGQDASGNWGATVAVVLTIEADSPAVSGTAVNPTTTDGTVLVALSASATDASTNIVYAEWFAGADPGNGNGSPMAISFNGLDWDLAATIDANGWAAGDHTISVRARDAAGNWSGTDSAILNVTAGPPTVTALHYFSTLGTGAVPGVATPYDDADVYLWDEAANPAFSRFLDGTADASLPGNADIDGLAYDGGVYYLSFNRNAGTNVPGVGVVEDEDVVTYNPGDAQWELFFAGVDVCDGMDASNGHDIDAFDVVNGVIYFSTAGNASIAGQAGPFDDADIYTVPGCSRVFDASVAGLPGNADIDGLTVVDADEFYISFNADGITVPTLVDPVQDEDVVLVQFDAGTNSWSWSLHFDGSAQGLGAANSQDLDAIDVQ